MSLRKEYLPCSLRPLPRLIFRSHKYLVPRFNRVSDFRPLLACFCLPCRSTEIAAGRKNVVSETQVIGWESQIGSQKGENRRGVDESEESRARVKSVAWRDALSDGSSGNRWRREGDEGLSSSARASHRVEGKRSLKRDKRGFARKGTSGMALRVSAGTSPSLESPSLQSRFSQDSSRKSRRTVSAIDRSRAWLAD